MIINDSFKFSVGEKVRVVGKDIDGEVTKLNYYVNVSKDGVEEKKKYGVRKGESVYMSVDWYTEDQLIRVSDIANQIDEKYIDGVYSVLIDVNLKNGKFDVVKGLVEEKEWECERG